MANDIVIPKNFGPMSTVFTDRTDGDELAGGIVSGFGVVGFRGKVWSIKYQGNELPLMREDGDGPRASIEVVLIRAAGVISKIFYANGWIEGSNEAPDCWSTNGVTPDAAVPNKVSAACLNCPNNAWGSRVTEQGKNSKACSDSKRLAIVPSEDLDNELFGGPLLLRIPAASLKDVKAYGDKLSSVGYKYYAVSTRISFDVKDSYPHLVFNAIRPLTDEEARKVLELREDERVTRILSENEIGAPHAKPEPEPEGSVFEQLPEEAAKPSPKAAGKPAQAQKAPAAGTAAPKAATATGTAQAKPQTQVKPKPTPAPVPEPEPEPEADEIQGREAEEGEGEEEGMEDFDAMLDGLLQ